MKTMSSPQNPLLKRALTSLAAIMAVTAIFAIKAVQWEARAIAAQTGGGDLVADSALSPAS